MAELLPVLEEIRDLLRRQQAESALLDKAELARLLSASPSTIDRMRAADELGPQPIRLTGDSGSLRWNRAEVLAWLNQRHADGSLHDDKTWPTVWAKIKPCK
jgi:predicted DNA-binding transcriptional regulator AlpA